MDRDAAFAMQARNYFGFRDWAGIAEAFQADIGPEGEFVYALYSKPPSEGSADVVFRRGGAWLLAGGGHCSCYGLEGQWRPEVFEPEIHLEAVRQGRRYIHIIDFADEYPEVSPENFDLWLAWAARQR